MFSVIWKEEPTTSRTPKIRIHEPLADSLHPFRFHFYSLFKDYGPVHILNLMWTSPSGSLAPEEKLGAAYAGCVEQPPSPRLLADSAFACRLDQLATNHEPDFMERTFYREFDVEQIKHEDGGIEAVPDRLARAVDEDVATVGATVVSLGKHGHLEEVVSRQNGVFRVNCRGKPLSRPAVSPHGD